MPQRYPRSWSCSRRSVPSSSPDDESSIGVISSICALIRLASSSRCAGRQLESIGICSPRSLRIRHSSSSCNPPNARSGVSVWLSKCLISLNSPFRVETVWPCRVIESETTTLSSFSAANSGTPLVMGKLNRSTSTRSTIISCSHANENNPSVLLSWLCGSCTSIGTWSTSS